MMFGGAETGHREVQYQKRSVNSPLELILQAENGGVIMVNFYSHLLSCRDTATVHDAVAHIEHVRSVAGAEHIGLGAGYDGINSTPEGLRDVSSYPVLFAELLAAGWSEDHLKRLAGLNFLRVLQRVEQLMEPCKIQKRAGEKAAKEKNNEDCMSASGGRDNITRLLFRPVGIRSKGFTSENRLQGANKTSQQAARRTPHLLHETGFDLLGGAGYQEDTYHHEWPQPMRLRHSDTRVVREHC